MSFHKSITISTVFASAIFLVALVNCEEISGADSRDTNYLGNVGSKQFFMVDGLANWQTAQMSCRSIGMSLATLNTPPEFEFIREQLMVADKGPFWLGARDIANTSMFRWSESYSAPNPNDPTTVVGDFIPYYNFVEQGPLALQMNKAIGGSVFGAHSFSATAKALCQVG